MIDTILGFKQKMGAVYIKDRRYPVTWVKVDPCVVTQVKHEEKDGYIAVQLGTGSKKSKNITKPLQGHLKIAQSSKLKAQSKTVRYIREIRIKEDSGLKVGDEVKLIDVLKKGDYVTVTGTSKGKGFAGGVKRWGFHGGPKTHGQSDRERAPGSIGQRTTPGRVYKGKHMAGRMGSERVTLKNLVVLEIDEKNNLIAIKGAVPGSNGGLIYVKKAGEGGESVEAEVKEVDSTDAKAVADKQVIEEKKEEKVEEVEKVELVEEVVQVEREENKEQKNEEPKNLKTEKQEDNKTEEKEVEKEVKVTK